MSQVGSLLSPVIVGRDDLVDLAHRRLDEVRGGGGRFLLASGEAGIGKTRLLGAIGSLAAGRGFRVAKAELAPQDRDVPEFGWRQRCYVYHLQDDLTVVLGLRMGTPRPCTRSSGPMDKTAAARAP